MNTIITYARSLLVLSLLSVGVATTGLAQADQQRFAGPRNTIPQTQLSSAATEAAHVAQADQRRFAGPRNTIPQTRAQEPSQRSERLQASKDESGVCHTTRVRHYGHPGKGVDRIERNEVPCGRSRLSER
jgi:hypothetical protein